MQHAIHLTLREGGTTLIALLVLAVMIYSLIFSVWRHLLKTKQLVSSGTWAEIGNVSHRLPWQTPHRNPREVERGFAAFELDEMAWVERRLPFLAVMIGAAPLLGLLGTVAGMLATFAGMASANGAPPIDSISSGISKALVTTQAGLVIAIPAAFLLGLLKRRAQSTHYELQRQLHEELGKAATTP